METMLEKPFFLPGGTTGCLLVHGFSGKPGEMYPLGDYLATQGFTVLGVRLAGHSANPESLVSYSCRDWLASAEAGLRVIRGYCSRIAVIGFSFGGALGLLLAEQYAIDRLVLLATPLMLQGDWRINVLPVMRYIVPWYYPLEQAHFDEPSLRQSIWERVPDADLDDPAVQQQIRRMVRLPVGAIDELRKGLRYARRRVHHVTTPTLIMHGREDDVAPPASADELLQRFGSTEKQLVWWDGMGHHMLTASPYFDDICSQIASCVQG